jgi:hypothetical protein
MDNALAVAVIREPKRILDAQMGGVNSSRCFP